MIEIDVHAHLAPVNAAELAALPGVQWLPEAPAMILDGKRVGVADLFRPQRLLAWMDDNSVRQAWVSIPPPLYRQALPAELADGWVRYCNRALLRTARASRGRLRALAHLPLEHPDLLASLWQDIEPELGSEGYAGLALAAGGHPGIDLGHPRLQPLWQWVDHHGLFVFLHPGSCADGRLASHYLENLVGNPYETGLAAASLVMNGVPSRFPRARICLAHAGGIFTSLCGRLDRGVETERPGVDTAIERPLQAARRLYVDCIAHHPGLLELAAEIVGREHVLFGSDWPFPMGMRPRDLPAGFHIAKP